VTDVGNTHHDGAVRTQAPFQPGQQRFRIAQMLEDIGKNDRIEIAVRDLVDDGWILQAASDDPVEKVGGICGNLGNVLHPPDFALLPLFESSSQCTLTTAHIVNTTGILRHQSLHLRARELVVLWGLSVGWVGHASPQGVGGGYICLYIGT